MYLRIRNFLDEFDENKLVQILCCQYMGMQSLAALALTGTECIKNKQTNKQTFFFIYIDVNLVRKDPPNRIKIKVTIKLTRWCCMILS